MADAELLTTDAEIDDALEQARHLPDLPVAVSASYHRDLDAIVLILEGGRRLILPRQELQGLQYASEAELSRIEIFGGTDICWPGLDLDHNLRSLLVGQYGSMNWMKELERRGVAETSNNSDFAMARLRAAYAIYPIASPFSCAQGQPLLAVKSISENGQPTGIAFAFASGTLLVAMQRDRSLEARYLAHEPDGTDISRQEPWSSRIGSAFGLGWLAINQHGYFDTVLLAFHGATPELALTAAGSELTVKCLA